MSDTRASTQTLTTEIAHLSQQHERSLSSPHPTASHQLTALTTALHQRATSTRDALRALALDLGRTPAGSTREAKRRQLEQLRREFTRALEDFRARELTFRERCREQVARQYRVAHPEASEEEAARAAEEWGGAGGEGVFQQAVCVTPLSSCLHVVDGLSLT